MTGNELNSMLGALSVSWERQVLNSFGVMAGEIFVPYCTINGTYGVPEFRDIVDFLDGRTGHL